MRSICLALATLAALAGCSTAIPVDLQATAAKDVEFGALRRFAVVHSANRDTSSQVLARQTANALQLYASRHGYQPFTAQQPLARSRDSNETMLDLAAAARRAFAAAGYRHSGADPQIAVSIDFAYGPFDYHVPPQVALRENQSGAIGGHADRAYAHAVMISVYDARRRDQPIWRGMAIAVNHIERFDHVAPELVEELAKLYPAPTVPVRKSVALRQY